MRNGSLKIGKQFREFSDVFGKFFYVRLNHLSKGYEPKTLLFNMYYKNLQISRSCDEIDKAQGDMWKFLVEFVPKDEFFD